MKNERKLLVAFHDYLYIQRLKAKGEVHLLCGDNQFIDEMINIPKTNIDVVMLDRNSVKLDTEKILKLINKAKKRNSSLAFEYRITDYSQAIWHELSMVEFYNDNLKKVKDKEGGPELLHSFLNSHFKDHDNKEQTFYDFLEKKGMKKLTRKNDARSYLDIPASVKNTYQELKVSYYDQKVQTEMVKTFKASYSLSRKRNQNIRKLQKQDR